VTTTRWLPWASATTSRRQQRSWPRRSIAAADDVATQYLWRSVRAKLVARRGSFAEAEALATEAIRIIEAAQDPDSQGYAYIDLAEVLRMAGRREEAMRAADDAAERFDQKGNTESAARARQLKAEIQAAAAVG
jgi:tetratricopeptide (TPR) repeat protein